MFYVSGDFISYLLVVIGGVFICRRSVIPFRRRGYLVFVFEIFLKFIKYEK